MKRSRVIDDLRKQLPGDWRYDHQAREWQRGDGMTARACAIVGGPAGDDYVGARLYVYPREGDPEHAYAFDVCAGRYPTWTGT